MPKVSRLGIHRSCVRSTTNLDVTPSTCWTNQDYVTHNNHVEIIKHTTVEWLSPEILCKLTSSSVELSFHVMFALLGKYCVVIETDTSALPPTFPHAPFVSVNSKRGNAIIHESNYYCFNAQSMCFKFHGNLFIAILRLFWILTDDSEGDRVGFNLISINIDLELV